jgi:tRNA-specific 2-thiouridylase
MMTFSTRKIAVALSGGIDSAVSALILKSVPNVTLVGLHMSNWNASDESSGSIYCKQSEKDASDAQLVANFLNIEMKRVEFQREYWHGVFEPFVEGFIHGKTLNPDVGCNQIIKFGAMRDYASKRLGANYVATGHYARLWQRDNSDQILGNDSTITTVVERTIEMSPEDEWIFDWGKSRDETIPLLLAAQDESKDQSYFLSGVKGSHFSNVIFPLGNLRKNHPSRPGEPTVRQLAEQFPFGISKKKESMGICFIGKRNFSDFLSEYLPEEAVPGSFVDIETGAVIGRHKGSAFYTVGQGAKISGATCKWFTVGKNNADGTVFVCNDTHHPALYSDELHVNYNDFNWIAGEIPRPLQETNNLQALCRIRHLQPLIPCYVTRTQDKLVIKFDRPVRAIAPGQTAALYVCGGIVCIGGGPICSRGPTYHELGKELIMSSLHPSGINDNACRD